MRLISARVAFRTAIVAALLAAFIPTVHAQFTSDYQTNVISGVTSNWWPEYIVGSNTVFDLLRVENGGVLSNDVGFIGYETSASNNAVIVNGSGARWTLAILAVGVNGSGSQLTITNGGRVQNSWDANVGTGPFGGNSSNNTIVVTGNSSVWTNGHYLLLSNHGSNNRLTVKDGGEVYAKSINLGVGGGSNEVTVTGIDSTLSGFDGIYVGFESSSNYVVVSDGGQLIGSRGGIGDSGSNNRVLVTGFGSIWSNWYGFSIGSNTFGGGGERYGGNSLVISNGGQVIDSTACVGCMFSDRNAVLVTGSGSLWKTLTSLSIGLWQEGGSGNRLVVSDQATVFSGTALIGTWWSNNSVLVTDSGSIWTNLGLLTIGAYGRGCSLVITNGGAVVTGKAEIGYSSRSNIVTVGGGGAVWIVQRGLAIDDDPSSSYQGYQGANSLVIGAGGTTVCSNLVLGSADGSCDSIINVAGGSLFVTNAAHDGVLELDSGTFTLSSGLVVADNLVVTNACAQFTRTGGTLIVGSLLLDANRDADGDGIPNGYEQSHDLDPLSAADASADNDGDGQSNLQEYLAGTDPTNSASAFRILGVVAANNDVLVTWATAGGRTNVVQSATDLTGSYTNISPNIFLPGSGGTTTNYLDAGGATNAAFRLYRIRLVP